jgi:hypothetical protein
MRLLELAREPRRASEGSEEALKGRRHKGQRRRKAQERPGKLQRSRSLHRIVSYTSVYRRDALPSLKMAQGRRRCSFKGCPI